MSDIMTVKEVANYLRMEEHTIYRLARKGLLPAFKLSGHWRFKKELIDKLIKEKSYEKNKKSLEATSS